MKNALLFLTIAVLSVTLSFSQDSGRKLPSVDIKNLDGVTINTSTFTNDGKPIIISFWATWCKPCVNELTSISDVYEEWQEETGVKIIAVSIDDTRTSASVRIIVGGKEWPYEIYLDENGDFKRAMNVNLIPHTFILNGNGEIVWQHTTFTDGSELEMIEIVRDIIQGNPIEE